MNLSEFEKMMQKHGQNVKEHMEPPFGIEGEDLNMKQSHKKISAALVFAAAAICLLGTGVFAAHQYLSAQQAAATLGHTKLAQKLQNSEAMSETITDGDYKATVLGTATGANIMEYQSSINDISPERTYVVVAVEKTDGSSMTYDDELLVTPLIGGLTPWQYNIFTMNGGSTSQVIDGVLYRIIEFDNIEYFADRPVYIGVVGNMFIDNQTFNFDEKTGKISTNDKFDGTNILFELKLDPSKANPQKAEKYLKALDESMNSSEDSEDIDEDESNSESYQTEDVEYFIKDASDSDEPVLFKVTESGKE